MYSGTIPVVDCPKGCVDGRVPVSRPRFMVDGEPVFHVAVLQDCVSCNGHGKVHAVGVILGDE